MTNDWILRYQRDWANEWMNEWMESLIQSRICSSVLIVAQILPILFWNLSSHQEKMNAPIPDRRNWWSPWKMR
jgi:hypothetical protein